MSDSVQHHYSKDGSSTLYSDHFSQFYHNPNGAISESLHVFFETTGLLKKLDSDSTSLTIFETGFGTGLNFLLLINQYLKRGLEFPVSFYSVEAFPVTRETAEKTNYANQLGIKHLKDVQSRIFSNLKPGWNTFSPLENKPVSLSLYVGFFDEITEIGRKADFFFHDPFSPDVNEELWTEDTFRKLRSFAASEAVLSTYCAASKSRASMAKAGWFIARAKGALGKREMTLASLSEDKLAGFKRLNEKRLIERLIKEDF